MPKEYFSHDYNARHDRKISALVKDYKSSGYGIFWATCEMMHEEGDRLEFDEITFDSISKDLNEDENVVKEVLEKCVSKYKLFIKEDVILTSNRVKKNFNGREEKRLAKVEAGRLGGISSGKSRSSKQNEAPLQVNEAAVEATKQIKLNKSKLNVNESKVNENNNNNDFVCYDAETFILGNRIIFEKICIATGKVENEVKTELHAYHLWMTKKENYPVGKKAVEAGIESWILNKDKFNKNGNQRSAAPSSRENGAIQLFNRVTGKTNQ